jgi:hypothetical protein
MMTRIITAYGDRIAADPAALAHLRDLQQALADQVNRGIFEANRSAAHYSQNEIAAILGISRQAVAKRIRLGEQAYSRTWQAGGAGALVRIADVRPPRRAARRRWGRGPHRISARAGAPARAPVTGDRGWA